MAASSLSTPEIARAERLIGRPLCRYCGKRIAKRTTTVWFRTAARPNADAHWETTKIVAELPRTREEAQRLVNGSITKTSSGYGPNLDRITMAHVWDGESYADRYFCTGEHAKRFAYRVLDSTPALGTTQYYDALRAALAAA